MHVKIYYYIGGHPQITIDDLGQRREGLKDIIQEKF